jgi:hypothetical protein
MTQHRDRNYATRHDPAEYTVAALMGPVVAYVIAYPEQTMPQIVDAFAHVPIRTMYRVIDAAARDKKVRRERIKHGTRLFCVHPYTAPKAAKPAAPVTTRDGHTESVWIHPIRARALGLPVASVVRDEPSPDYAHPNRRTA